MVLFFSRDYGGELPNSSEVESRYLISIKLLVCSVKRGSGGTPVQLSSLLLDVTLTILLLNIHELCLTRGDEVTEITGMSN